MNEPIPPLEKPHVLSGPFWAELRVFLAVAKARSFNRAAEDLRMSQPTVSRQVRRLQDVLGIKLVMPTQAGIRLTEKGEELAKSLHDLDQRLFDISSELSAEARMAQGTVRLAATGGLAGYFLAPSMAGFSDDYPNIRIQHRTPVDLLHFRENQVDVMIAFSPSRESDVTSRPLGFLHCLPVASCAYVARYGVPTCSSLDAHYFVHCDYYSSDAGLWDDWHALMAQGTISHSSDNAVCYAMLVRSGLGIGLVGTYALCDPEAVPLELGVHIRLPIYVHALTERLSAKPIRLVYDWISEVLSPSISWFAPDLRLDLLSEQVSLPVAQSLDGLRHSL